jgi:hypothetical protein
VLPEAPQVAARVSHAIIDDVLVHEMHFEKHGNIFTGYMQGRRIVLVRMGTDQYGIACSDGGVANEVLLLLRSLDIQVKEVEV